MTVYSFNFSDRKEKNTNFWQFQTVGRNEGQTWIHDGWSQTCFVTQRVTQKFEVSQLLKKVNFVPLFVPVCQQWINIDPIDESRCIFVMLVTQIQSQQWKKTYSLCGCSSEASDWQTGELVATGSSNDDLSPTTHYTSHISGSRAGMDAGSPGLFFCCVHERCRHSGFGCISQASWQFMSLSNDTLEVVGQT